MKHTALGVVPRMSGYDKYSTLNNPEGQEDKKEVHLISCRVLQDFFLGVPESRYNVTRFVGRINFTPNKVGRRINFAYLELFTWSPNFKNCSTSIKCHCSLF
jgi:hypothetical protein